jgi:hypothetical protein
MDTSNEFTLRNEYLRLYALSHGQMTPAMLAIAQQVDKLTAERHQQLAYDRAAAIANCDVEVTL